MNPFPTVLYKREIATPVKENMERLVYLSGKVSNEEEFEPDTSAIPALRVQVKYLGFGTIKGQVLHSPNPVLWTCVCWINSRIRRK